MAANLCRAVFRALLEAGVPASLLEEAVDDAVQVADAPLSFCDAVAKRLADRLHHKAQSHRNHLTDYLERE